MTTSTPDQTSGLFLGILLQHDLCDQLLVEVVQLFQTSFHVVHEDDRIFERRSPVRRDSSPKELPAQKRRRRPTSIESRIYRRSKPNRALRYNQRSGSSLPGTSSRCRLSTSASASFSDDVVRFPICRRISWRCLSGDEVCSERERVLRSHRSKRRSKGTHGGIPGVSAHA